MCEHNSICVNHQSIDPANDVITTRHRKRTTGTKIILYVDYDQGLHRCFSLLDVSGEGPWVLFAQPAGLINPVCPLHACGLMSYLPTMYTIAALYHFTRFADPAAYKGRLAQTACAHGVTGSLLLAPEGINGTIAGSNAGIAAVISQIRALPGCADLEWKESASPTPPFAKMKVRLKREIVTMGQPDVDPAARTGNYVVATDWNDLINRDDVAVIDTRNDYEVAIGSFDGAIDPGTQSFGEFPAWWQANKHRFHNKKIAMFCTGGIRCEKSTNYLLGQGIKDVYHLKGGILNYLEHVPEQDSLWRGECFVFDERVSVGHGLAAGTHGLCRACRRPLSEADIAHDHFSEGVSCPRCYDERSDEQRARYAERNRQARLAQERGEEHIGRLDEAERDG